MLLAQSAVGGISDCRRRRIAMLVRLALAAALLSPWAVQACSDLLTAQYRPLSGKQPMDLCAEFEGKVLLVVNTASKCGFTPQYEGLEALHAKLSDRGFAVLGFPSNDFMGQEPGSEDEIKEFCTLTYGVKFPMFEKVHVVGDETTPLYRKLKAATGEEPGWNFHKYLIDRHGNAVASFGSKTTPDDAKLAEQIEKLLAEPVPAGVASEKSGTP
jgi:glutathione peroxidase